MRKDSEILADALASFEDGKRWIQGTLFRDKYGRAPFIPIENTYERTLQHLFVGAEEAENFCAIGALYKSITKD